MKYYDYTDIQKRMADAALKCVMESDGLQESYKVYHVMSSIGKDASMVKESMVDELGLFRYVGGSLRITFERRRAYRMGFGNYIRRKDFSKRFGENKDVFAIGIAVGSLLVTIVLGILQLILSWPK